MDKGKKDMSVKAGDQSMKLKHKGSRHYQGDDCCSPKDFDQLTGKEGALTMKPKVTGQPSAGTPGDALKGKMAGKAHSKPDSGEKTKELMPMKTRPARNSKSK